MQAENQNMASTISPNPSTAEVVTPLVETEIFSGFDEMSLPENLLRGVYSYGFEKPSFIQQRGIVPIAKGRDILAQAQSGTGKTGTFTIGSMSRIDVNLPKVQVLVLAPVRELAQQIEGVARNLGQFMPVKVYSATGGTPLRDDIRAIEKGVQFLIGTPGRIFDLMNRRIIQRENIRVLILDEADQMLEDRFRDQIMAILELGFPSTTRVALFSATLPPEVIEVAEKLLQDPVRILVQTEDVTLDGIHQYYVSLQKEEWKFECLCDLYQQLNINQALIYCNKRQRAEWIADKLSAQGFPLSFIHGEMDVEERKKRMRDFRNGEVRVLISTDMLARGIDVQQVSLVINYELPSQRENYVHRIGRSGRFGRKGVAINLVAPNELEMLKELEQHYTTKITELPENINNILLS
jgi:translation initiation factor 4A